ncbi:MAG: polysaccharide deacetylase, partial [Clostridia bacterium]|nr:polysaccharide deacetylase [Clostridia bacterium]
MLYDNNEETRLVNVYNNHEKLNIKKVAIFITSVLMCFIVLVGSFLLSYNKMAKPTEDTESTSTEPVDVDVPHEEKAIKTEHVQIAKHNIEKMKSKFIPEYNENAQEDIKNLYFSTEKVAYLTFDDGPSATITPQILDILKNENVPATFFVVGARVNKYPNLVKRAYEEGHYIANHGYTHSYSEIYKSLDTIFGEYVDCENAVRNALGIDDYRMYLFRYPGGSAGGRYSDVKNESKNVLNSYGVTYTNWNCMTGDAEGKNTVEEQLEELKATMEGDDTIIVLMHDASDKQVTADALPEVIRYLKEQGYTFKNFYEIF